MLDTSKVNFALNEVFVCAPEQKVKESIYCGEGLEKGDCYFFAKRVDWSRLDPLAFEVLILQQTNHNDQSHAIANTVMHFYQGNWLWLSEIWN